MKLVVNGRNRLNDHNGVDVALSTPGMREPLVVRDFKGSTVDDAIEVALHSNAEPRKRQQLTEETSSGHFDVLYRGPGGRLQKLGRKSLIGDTPDEMVELEIHRYLEVGSAAHVAT